MSGCFFLLTLLAYARYVAAREASRPASRPYLVTLACFAAGLMCKPMVVSLPLVLLALDFWPFLRGKSPEAWRRLVVEKLPFLALVGGRGNGNPPLTQRQSRRVSVLGICQSAARAGNAVRVGRPLHRRLLLAVRSRRLLSASRPLANCDNRGCLRADFGYLRAGLVAASRSPLGRRGIGLVSCRPSSGHRPDSGRVSGNGGPIHLPAAHGDRTGIDLERTRPGLADGANGRGWRGRVAAGCLRGANMEPGGILAELGLAL